MDITANPMISDIDPMAQKPIAEVQNPGNWNVVGDVSPEQQALDERQEHFDANSEEFRLLLSNHDAAPADNTASALNTEGAAPRYTDTLPDGREVVISGDPSGDADLCHEQGDNDLGFSGDCGLCSSQDVLNQFGVGVSENDVVHHAVDNHLCDVDPSNPENSGGTSADWECKVLADYGVPAHVENNGQLEDLARNLENGSGVIAEVNAGVLWNDAGSFDDGSANHAITVTGVVRDEATGKIEGFYVNDSGDGHGAKFVDATTMQTAWMDAGGQSVVTDITH